MVMTAVDSRVEPAAAQEPVSGDSGTVVAVAAGRTWRRCGVCARPDEERAAIEQALRDGMLYRRMRARWRISTTSFARHAREMGLPPRFRETRPRRVRGCALCRKRPKAVVAAVNDCLRAGVPQREITRLTGVCEATWKLHRKEIGLGRKPPAPLADPDWTRVRPALPASDLVSALRACGMSLSLSRKGLTSKRMRGGQTPARVRRIVNDRALEIVRELKRERQETADRQAAALRQLANALDEPRRRRAERAAWERQWPITRERLEEAERDFLEIVSWAFRAAAKGEHASAERLLVQGVRVLRDRWLPNAVLADRSGYRPFLTSSDGAILFIGPRQG